MESGNNSWETGASASRSPKEVNILLSVRSNLLAIGHHYIDGDDMLTCKAPVLFLVS
jgi:hypothetical protein